jgi:hypothetical protein
MDRIRILDCYASPSKKEPGRIFYNCKSVQLEQSWLDVCSDDAYLAQQSLNGQFILTSRDVMCNPEEAADGIFSRMAWPNDVSIVTRQKTEEIPLLTFRVQYMKWTAEHVTTKEQPPTTTMEFKLWANHCEQLVPGPLEMVDWKAIMANGRNPINFAVVCSSAKDNKWATVGGAQQVKVHAFRADTLGYLMSTSCPPVSRALVQQYTKNKGKKPKAPSSSSSSIVNVSADGLLNAKAFSTFRALTCNPDELTSEDALREGLEAGTVESVVFFGLQTTIQVTMEQQCMLCSLWCAHNQFGFVPGFAGTLEPM